MWSVASFEKTCAYSAYSAERVFFGFTTSACMARSADMVNLLRVAAARGVMKQDLCF